MERFDLMGTTAQVVVFGDPRLRRGAIERLRELERRWSRFVPDSEISQLNEAAGRPLILSRESCRLVSLACAAWRLTAGRFDPTVYDAVIASGYDRSWSSLEGHPSSSGESSGPAPGCSEMYVDAVSRLVWLPRHVRFDPGGIGKGLAADIVAEELIEQGAEAALVEIGGDIRVVGAPRQPWRIGIEHPHWPGKIVGTCRLEDGGVVTSSRLKRRWQTQRGTRNHLIDPTTGRNSLRDLDTVTVVAGTAWWAEALTKALFFSPPHEWAGLLQGNAALGIDPEGGLTTSGNRRLLKLSIRDSDVVNV
jgi:FAD:protein FMN transferase